MKKFFKRSLFSFMTIMLAASFAFGQGVTTASLNGLIKDTTGEPLIGVNVVAVHTPSGTMYGTTTRLDGQYNIPAVRIGGPYTVTITYVGFQEQKQENLYFSLGENRVLNFKMSDTAVEIETVTVTANLNSVLNSDRSGAETRIGAETINTIPSLNYGINDFAKLTPQASTSGDGLSIAGMNNRFNAIYIDGAVNNDVFGLAADGTNGGQTGITPISLDSIEQFQIVVAPYDVRQGGFAGGGINAVTRSGTNKFEGSVYFRTRNQNLTGKTNREVFDYEKTLSDAAVDSLRTRVDEFSANTYGLRIGGPIIKNKLFFFANAEIQRDQTPRPFQYANYNGDYTEADINSLVNHLQTAHGYNPGGYLDNTRELKGEKFLIKLDYNLNQTHKLTARHSYARGRSLSPSSSSTSSINFANNGIFFPSTTNSSAIELKSIFGSSSANELTIGFTKVFDDRDPLGSDFPWIQIEDNGGRVFVGSERFSTANQLKQSTFTLTDNYTMYKGKHTITVGTHNEFFSIYNLFIRENFGVYKYNSIDDFISGADPFDYDRSYSLVDDITGDGSAAASSYNALQLGLYAQDKIAIGDKLTVTAGLRIDVPFYTSKPEEDTNFNTTTIPLIEAQGYDLEGAEAGKMPKPSVMFGPRVGFNFDPIGDRSTQIRGGLGIFTGRIPFVWPGGAYTNNGLTIGGVSVGGADLENLEFEADPSKNYEQVDFGGMDVVPSGQMDLFAKNFKYPQVFRANLAVDRQLPWGLTATLEGLYTKTINNVLYKNLNVKPSTENFAGVDNRPLYDRFDEVDDTYGRIMLGTNTSKGYTYNITAQVEKKFDKGLSASLAYTYGSSYAVNDGSSSQNSSQWRYVENIGGRNNIGLSRSDYDLGSRIVGLVSYRLKYINDHIATTFSLYYNGQSGNPFSYTYGGRMHNDDSAFDNDLIFVPADASQINLLDITDSNGDVVNSAADQWADLDNFIKNDDYLSTRRGQYAERNGARLPFTSNWDFRIAQDVGLKVGNDVHRLQVTFDILNFANLLNNSWGARYSMSNDLFALIDYEGFSEDAAGAKTPEFTFEPPRNRVYGVNDLSSRWRMQIGLRYLFN